MERIGWLGSDSVLYTAFLPFGEATYPPRTLLLVLATVQLPLPEQSPPYRAAAPLLGSSCNDNMETSISIAG